MAKKPVDNVDGTDEAQDTHDDIGGGSSKVKVEAVEVFEELPSFVADKNWKFGRTLKGYFVSSKKIFSDKFSAGRIDPATGKTCRMRHILEDTNGVKFVIWGLGTLDMIFKRCRPGQYIEVTLTGRAEKPLKPKQTPPYLFDIKSDKPLLDLDDAPETGKDAPAK